MILQISVLGIMALLLWIQHRSALVFMKSAMQRLAGQPFTRLDVEGLTADTGLAGFSISWQNYELVLVQDSVLFVSYLRWGRFRQYIANYGQLYVQGMTVSSVVPKRFSSPIRSAVFKGADLVLAYSMPMGLIELPHTLRLRGIGNSRDVDTVKRMLRIA